MRFLSMRHCKYLTTQWLCSGMRGLISPSFQNLGNFKSKKNRFFKSVREDSFSKNHIELGLRLQKTLPSTWMSWDKSLASHCPPAKWWNLPKPRYFLDKYLQDMLSCLCSWTSRSEPALRWLFALPCQNQFTQINLTYGSFIWYTHNYSISTMYTPPLTTCTFHLRPGNVWKTMELWNSKNPMFQCDPTQSW